MTKLTNILVVLTLILASCGTTKKTSILNTNSVYKEITCTSIRGTWNKTKDQTKAQFGGDNALLFEHFRNCNPVLVSVGGEFSVIYKVTFKITTKGEVDSIKIEEGLNELCDRFILQIIEVTSGKWRPGKLNGINTSEYITIWINFYKGPVLKKGLRECIKESEKLIEKGDYTEAIKYLDVALTYDRFNIKAITLKVNILKNLNQMEVACKLLIENQVYYSELINNLIKTYCKN